MLRLSVSLLLLAGSLFAAQRIRVATPSAADPRISYGVEPLKTALAYAGHEIEPGAKSAVEIEVESARENDEGYRLIANNGRVIVRGRGAAGAMYGCLDLAARLREGKRLPSKLDITESPALDLRGTSVFLMKLGTYDYPVTPREFPFFYDKKLWIEYLDLLARNRYNYIAFWNGHPFDYFVNLDKYPEAQTGMEAGLLERNHDMLMWLSHEAQRRNIWLMFQFYNIHTSVYFQKAHNLPAWNPVPTPLLAEYTSYCIERFVSEFPSVGLYICPGEALRLQHTDGWINDVIFPAVKRTSKNPPIMIRAWGIDLPHARKVAGNYRPLYTERKFNVEMIASTEIDPENSDWARVTGKHVAGIHMMGNLEPFRWSPPHYVQRIIQNSLGAGAKGLRLDPRKAWRWPYGADRVPAPELQWDRDWMWFETWARYAWNTNREPKSEREFWIRRLALRYGSAKAARYMLDSQEAGADVLPGIQRLVWLHYDNHCVVSAGILLEQLEQAKGIPFLVLPRLVRIPQYLDALRKGETIKGETPVDFLAARVRDAEKAVSLARLANSVAINRKSEAGRVLTDTEAVLLVAKFYHHKMQAAAAKATGDKGRFKALLAISLDDYRNLTNLTRTTYESLSDVPAWYPVRFKPDICPYHWTDILPYLEREQAQLW